MDALSLKSFSCETERLWLRPLTEGDEALFHALYTDAQIMRFIGMPLTTAEAASRFRKIVRRQADPALDGRFLAIVEKYTQKPLGICGAAQHDPVTMRLEIGLVLLPEGRRLGIARDALTALVNRAFDERLVDEVYACIASGNTLARNLLSRAGFRLDLAEEKKAKDTMVCHWSMHRSSRCAD